MTSIAAAKLWWISWEQHDEDGAPEVDPRPTTYPPPAAVLGWWLTGHGDGFSTVVAIVRAKSASAAASIIAKAWKPGVGEWRFNREYRESGPPGDRFPPPDRGDWNYERWPWRRSP